ncbi:MULTISPECIES: 3-hydroxyisobutyrate dehydrogenase [Spongiibacter]|uniref:3-hydroxyisobutyrate dehydrogenase n=1 Tax=Spongiibacter TaxID=630749 RepID=UPI000C39940B|nr:MULTISPECIES: 3-hydroxyisobutyrate dehydrogenase [Spongiibacter]MAY39395.1 3-hydroxyisobutyrate dehydrogenase [Spongiibacter sp.]MBI57265.1 3-hydroxyisobutyrate dehydrogenase [Spongiibacter sp.]MBO6753312.1 3-hydroxyisobutyrate dehydrogenase [Spongiibacter sp.]
MSNIAFIGLGNMGGPMAANLMTAGHSLTVFDLSEAAMQALAEKGARCASSALEAIEGAEVILSMLPAGKHVAGLYLGENGLIAKAAKGTLILDCSTIDAETARQVGAAAEAAGLAMLDAPVSGGVKAAQAGTLAFMCGGSEAGFVRAEKILSGMGKKIFHAGDHGAGQIAKMCNNMLLAVHMIGTAEALQLGMNNGLDAGVLSEIMKNSSGDNWSLQNYNPVPGVMPGTPASNDYQPGFMAQLMLKDLGLAMENSLKTQSAVPMGAMARSLYASFAGKGNSQRDFSAIIEMMQGE